MRNIVDLVRNSHSSSPMPLNMLPPPPSKRNVVLKFYAVLLGRGGGLRPGRRCGRPRRRHPRLILQLVPDPDLFLQPPWELFKKSFRFCVGRRVAAKVHFTGRCLSTRRQSHNAADVVVRPTVRLAVGYGHLTGLVEQVEEIERVSLLLGERPAPPVHEVLTEGRAEMGLEVRERIQTYMQNYGTGIRVTQVNIDESAPPDAVRAAFADVIKAREDEVRLRNEADAYANQIVPEARGDAQQQISTRGAPRTSPKARPDMRTCW